MRHAKANAPLKLMPLPAFDVQLRERFLQRRLDRGDFFAAEIFFHRRLRARDGGFGRGFVDRGRFERHVGQDGNAVAGDLGKTFADRERGFVTAFENAQLAGLERGQDRDVLRVNAKLAVASREARPSRHPRSRLSPPE